MQALTDWLQQLQFHTVFEMLLLVLSSLLCITVHETSHGVVAYWMGDDTAKRQGRLSLNPLRHIDPAGLIMMAIARFGWAKPVPVDMRRFRHRRLGMALTALAGPVSNVLLMLAAAIVRVLLLLWYYTTNVVLIEYVALFFEYIVVLSAGLAVFNLFPIPPLDGSKILFAFLPSKAYYNLMRYERFGMVLLIVLLFTNVLDTPLRFMRDHLIELANIATWPFVSIFQQFI